MAIDSDSTCDATKMSRIQINSCCHQAQDVGSAISDIINKSISNSNATAPFGKASLACPLGCQRLKLHLYPAFGFVDEFLVLLLTKECVVLVV